jgi:hypothetical protein
VVPSRDRPWLRPAWAASQSGPGSAIRLLRRGSRLLRIPQGPRANTYYDITFDLTGFDLSTASIYGRWSVDNVGNDILLNGVSTGNLNNNGFTAWTDFTISVDEGDIFLPGLNTLRFATFNGPGAGPTGSVRIEFFERKRSYPIPEPSAMLLYSGGPRSASALTPAEVAPPKLVPGSSRRPRTLYDRARCEMITLRPFSSRISNQRSSCLGTYSERALRP